MLKRNTRKNGAKKHKKHSPSQTPNQIKFGDGCLRRYFGIKLTMMVQYLKRQMKPELESLLEIFRD